MGLENCGGEMLFRQIGEKPEETNSYYEQFQQLLNKQTEINFTVQVNFVKTLVLPKLLLVKDSPKKLMEDPASLNLIESANGFVLFYAADSHRSLIILTKILRLLISWKRSDRIPLILCEFSNLTRLVSLAEAKQIASMYCFDLKYFNFSAPLPFKPTVVSASNPMSNSMLMLNDLPKSAPALVSVPDSFNNAIFSDDISSKSNFKIAFVKEKMQSLVEAALSEVTSAETIRKLVRNRRQAEYLKQNPPSVFYMIVKCLLLIGILFLISGGMLYMLSGSYPESEARIERQEPFFQRARDIIKKDRKAEAEREAQKAAKLKPQAKAKEHAGVHDLFHKHVNSEETRFQKFVKNWYCDSSLADYFVENKVEESTDFLSQLYHKLTRKPNFVIWLESYCKSTNIK